MSDGAQPPIICAIELGRTAMRKLRLTAELAGASGLVLAAIGLSATPSHASCVTWLAGSSGQWGTGANWSGGAYPNSAGTDACVTDNVSTVTLDVNATVHNLNLGTVNTLTTNPGVKLTVAGNKIDGGFVHLNAGGGADTVLTLANDVTLSNPDLPNFGITLASGGGGGTAFVRGAGHTLTNTGFVGGAGVVGDDGLAFVNSNPNAIADLWANTPGGVLDVGSGGGAFTTGNGGFVWAFAGSTMKVTGDSNGFVQTGGITEVDGELIAPNGVRNESGMLDGTGTIVGDVFNDSELESVIRQSFNYPGLLTITGDLSLSPSSHVGVSIDSNTPGTFSRYVISGDATLSGVLDLGKYSLNFKPGPIPMGVYDIMDFASSTGDFTSLDYKGQPCTLGSKGGSRFWMCASNFNVHEVIVGGTHLDLIVAPEPATWAMLLIGLGGLGGLIRRRQAPDRAS
jgi:hypothetical protein